MVIAVVAGLAILFGGAVVVRLLLNTDTEILGVAAVDNMNAIYLQTAATDVLRNQGIALGQVPRCAVSTENKATYSCSGTTAEGEKITVSVRNATADEPSMSVTVGTKQIFSGSITDVIVKNARTG